MKEKFKKLMREQIQESLKNLSELSGKTIPKGGWIKSIRQALEMPVSSLANRLGCSRNNITALEQREKKGSISLKTLEEVAQALNCKLVYCLVPLDSLDETIEQQARKVAKKQIKTINHSMLLEQQGLTAKQLKNQEENLVKELMQGNLKKLWR